MRYLRGSSIGTRATQTNTTSSGRWSIGDIYTAVRESTWPTKLLDTYTGASAAYSLRKLKLAYTGSAVRVRRSSDNTEQDIGFIGDNLDATALTTFCGAGNGFITKWYDQTGQVNISQSTTTYQPKIVTSGVYEEAIVFDGSDDYLIAGSSTDLSFAFGTSLTLLTRVYVTGTSGYRTLIGKREGGASSSYEMFFSPNETKFGLYNGSGLTTSLTNGGTNTWFHASVVVNASSITYFLNGVADGTASYGIAAANNGVVNVGRIGGTSNSQYLPAKLSELVIYNSALSQAAVGGFARWP